MRKTKIVCTMGPSTMDENVLRRLIEEGMDVARLNFSHGTHEEQKIRMDMVKKLRKECGKHIAILLDTKGPEIRTRDFEGGKVELVAGQTFVLTTEEIMGTAQKAAISYKNLKDDISGNNLDLKHTIFWQNKKDVAPVGDYEYSFAVIGDTEYN